MVKFISLYHKNNDNIEKTNFDNLYQYYKNIPNIYNYDQVINKNNKFLYHIVEYYLNTEITVKNFKKNRILYYLEIKNNKLLYDNYCYIYRLDVNEQDNDIILNKNIDNIEKYIIMIK